MTLLRGPKILYVDNDPSSAGSVRAWLTGNAPGCRVVSVGSGKDALDRVKKGGFDLYEYSLGEFTGPELCRAVRRLRRDSRVVICSRLGQDLERSDASEAGATEYLVKSEEFCDLSATIRKHLGPLPRLRKRLTPRRSASII